MAERHAAREKTGDAREALGPAVGFRGRLARGPEAEEDGVARLHADEGRPRVVRDAVGQPGDEAAGQQEEGGVAGRDGLGEVGEAAAGEASLAGLVVAVGREVRCVCMRCRRGAVGGGHERRPF